MTRGVLKRFVAILMITTIIFYVPAFAKTGENSSETKNNMDATGSLENAESSNERLNKNYTIVSGGYTLMIRQVFKAGDFSQNDPVVPHSGTSYSRNQGGGRCNLNRPS